MVGTRRFRLSQRAVVFGKPGFIGVNGDFNIPNLPAYYNTPLTIATLGEKCDGSTGTSNHRRQHL
jgi:hypothetical protein